MASKKTYCGDCAFFLYPEPSRIYDGVLVTFSCPHSAHRTERGGYATGGMLACESFRKAEQLQIVFDYGK